MKIYCIIFYLKQSLPCKTIEIELCVCVHMSVCVILSAFMFIFLIKQRNICIYIEREEKSQINPMTHVNFASYFFCHLGNPCGVVVKNLPAMQETQVRSLSQEDPSEEEMATHSSVFAWRIPWTKEPGEI